MTERERQDIILKNLCEVCDRLYEIWNDASKIEDYELRRLVMRETAGEFVTISGLCLDVDMAINSEVVYHA